MCHGIDKDVDVTRLKKLLKSFCKIFRRYHVFSCNRNKVMKVLFREI